MCSNTKLVFFLILSKKQSRKDSDISWITWFSVRLNATKPPAVGLAAEKVDERRCPVRAGHDRGLLCYFRIFLGDRESGSLFRGLLCLVQDFRADGLVGTAAGVAAAYEHGDNGNNQDEGHKIPGGFFQDGGRLAHTQGLVGGSEVGCQAAVLTVLKEDNRNQENGRDDDENDQNCKRCVHIFYLINYLICR